jgi:hypothetical protein
MSRAAKIVVLGAPGSGRSELMGAFAGVDAESVSVSGRALWVINAPSYAPDLYATVVLHRATAEDRMISLRLALEDAAAVVLVEDVGSPSAERVRAHVNAIRAFALPDTPILLAGVRADRYEYTLATAAQRVLFPLGSELGLQGWWITASSDPGTIAAFQEQLVSAIDWAGALKVTGQTLDEFRDRVSRLLRQRESVVFEEEWLASAGRPRRDWVDADLRITGTRRLTAAGVLILDPDVFEKAVDRIVSYVARGPFGLPAVRKEDLERDEPVPHFERERLERIVRPVSLGGDISEELQRMGWLVTLQTESGPVVAMPSAFEPGTVEEPDMDTLAPVLGASLTGPATPMYLLTLLRLAYSGIIQLKETSDRLATFETEDGRYWLLKAHDEPDRGTILVLRRRGHADARLVPIFESALQASAPPDLALRFDKEDSVREWFETWRRERGTQALP